MEKNNKNRAKFDHRAIKNGLFKIDDIERLIENTCPQVLLFHSLSVLLSEILNKVKDMPIRSEIIDIFFCNLDNFRDETITKYIMKEWGNHTQIEKAISEAQSKRGKAVRVVRMVRGDETGDDLSAFPHTGDPNIPQTGTYNWNSNP